jgi:hypothetical protein
MSRRTVFVAGVLSLAGWALALTGCAGIPGGHTLAVQPSAARLQAFRGGREESAPLPEYELYYSGNRELCVYHYNYGWRVLAAPPALLTAAPRPLPVAFVPFAINP